MGRSESEKCCNGIGNWSLVRQCLLVVLLASGVILVSTAFEGRFGTEKSLTAMVMPVGFVWLNLSACMLQSWIGKWSSLWRCGFTVCWLIMTAITTAPVPDALYAQFERPIEGEFRPDVDPPLDVLVVFGGGTKIGPNRPEVAEAGDRLVYAAQLYHRGCARHLLATGKGADVETLVIWRDLAIPLEKISTIEGRNTFEEISNLVDWLDAMNKRDEAGQAKRVGILSSAFHIPRIQRLADKAGLKGLVPVSSHHRISPNPYTVLNFVPSLGPLTTFAEAQREMMGRLVGR